MLKWARPVKKSQPIIEVIPKYHRILSTQTSNRTHN